MAPKEPWPFGQVTTTCTSCRGTGMNRAQVDVHVTSRGGVLNGRDDIQARGLICGECGGRGRVIAPGTTPAVSR